MTINSIRRIRNIKSKTIFLRVDFNVPLKAGQIVEDYKIKDVLETINFFQEKGAKIILASHLGRPQGRKNQAYSLRPIAVRLRKLLKLKVKFVSEPLGPKLKNITSKMKDGDIILLENLRFYPGEYANDPKFAAELASLADLYVNEAFAVSHRTQASVAAIKNFIPAYAGLLLEKEIKALNRILKPRKPLVVVMGGAKIATKMPLILKLKPLASKILIGGALANSFFKFQGLEIGKSLVDKDSKKNIKHLFKEKKLNSKIVLPQDLVVKNKKGEAQVLKPGELRSSDKILDIGPASINKFAKYIKKAQTLVWNGPMGKFEEKSYKHGTISIATLIAARSSGLAYGVVGGGETVEALKLTKMINFVDWVSTGGGALLSYLGGEEMPGLSKILKK